MDTKEIKGTLNSLKENGDESKEVSTSDSSKTEISRWIADTMAPPEKKENLKLKGIYFKPEQIKSIEKYSKKAGKSQSEFVRNAIDFLIEKVKENDY